ncbi:hypothetical protein N7468_006574 [Penicillium chermesinum]|uniref:Rrn9 domain-containing protein n=1 Tax=Penicillium chermesinum TaxID=63820 RepID=A0A9W9TJZ4_9EURO|nr:uncharacterized protein N7468_006574 [Penicillium chermesinum]KAJ5225349.1 hypothetical protein N7468_006574 [Penicillium chermesinum]KAJ6161425.1 hypothetical protein N7470_004821 [Penicillium chermesinum]
MSSRDDQLPSSSQFYPPQSAQRVRSLFGGPSSDVGPRSSPQLELEELGEDRELDGQPVKENELRDGDFELMLGDFQKYADDSADEDYRDSGSDDDVPRPDHRRGRSRRSSATASNTTEDQSMIDEPEPQIIYSLRRENDLSEDSERPNRWAGTPSAYYRAIAQERGVYDSLASNGSRNLSNHLYNAYALRHSSKVYREGTLETEEAEDDEVAAFRKRWVAWPMSAATVPCPSEPLYRKQADLGIYGKPADFRPSADLEDSIIASMMNTAQQRFKAREWDNDGLKINPEKRTAGPDDMDTMDEDKKDHDDAHLGAPVLKPVIQSDDDISRRQLLPLSRNVITQVDKLLMGLHHSIRNRVDDIESSDDSATDEDASSSGRSKGNRKGRGRGRTQSRGRKRARRGSRSERESNSRRNQRLSAIGDQGIEGDKEEDGENEMRPTMLDRMALRDWSEVMGVASMIGLPAGAVKRASRRCADLFNQDMTFRTLQEGRMEPVSRLPGSKLQYAYIEDEIGSGTGPAQKPRAPSRVPPSQSKKAHSTILALSQGTGPQPQSFPAGVPASSFPAPSSSAALPTFPNTDGAAPRKPDGHYCPFPTCKQHTHPFPRIWNFKLHLERKHPEYYETVKDSLVIRKKKS